MKIFIIAYNRVTWLRDMCEFILDTGHTPIIIDNASTYQPLLDWYSDSKYIVHRLDRNYGHFAYWTSGISKLYNDKYFAVSDHDLELSTIPIDYIDILLNALISTPNVIKAGLSLRIDDLPDNPYTKEVINWEKKFWQNKLPNGFYSAPIDTTMAVYDKDRDFGELPGLSNPSNDKFFTAIRSPEPYVCRHLPWYNTKEFIENNEEEKYYFEHSGTYWNEQFKKLMQ